jgi:hypothetical protein
LNKNGQQLCNLKWLQILRDQIQGSISRERFSQKYWRFFTQNTAKLFKHLVIFLFFKKTAKLSTTIAEISDHNSP